MNYEFTKRQMDRQAKGIKCEAPGCYYLVSKVGRFCEAHDKQNQRTGHPLGRMILRGELKPYLARARSFLSAHREHPGILSALEWISKLLREGAEREPKAIHAKSLPRDRLARWLGRMFREGVEPEAVLSMVIAMVLYQEDEPRRFMAGQPGSDRFFRHQLSNRVLQLTPGKCRYYKQGPTITYDRQTVGVRDLLAEKLLKALGVLAIRAARHIMKEDEAKQWRITEEPVQGCDAPFTISHNTIDEH